MAKILVSGLVNVETTCAVRQFPVEYYPIDYPFFGVRSAVSGVAYNIAKGLRTLGDHVGVLSMTGDDFQSRYIR
ncbi:MAG: carbohydrate kinase family protein, partial [Oscillospiraceae bacterium]|nr:carbohydrate kinase family protein [Oscillospiraceae bacterium]